MTLGKTKIPYLSALWHPTTGCSCGCAGCWARDLVRNRLAGTMKGLPPEVVCQEDPTTEQCDPFYPTFHEDRLADPLKARKPQVIGVSFLGDLFDPGITDEQIAAVFGVMAASPQHTFIVLTKQAERMERWFGWCDSYADGHWYPFGIEAGKYHIGVTEEMRQAIASAPRATASGPRRWPLPNVWNGVSVCDQPTADARIPHLLRTPAARRWVSYEPARGAVDMALSAQVRMDLHGWHGKPAALRSGVPPLEHLDAVIQGGESGPTSRQHPMDLAWARSMAAQCKAAGVPFALKQSSGLHPEHWPEVDGVRHRDVPWMEVSRV